MLLPQHILDAVLDAATARGLDLRVCRDVLDAQPPEIRSHVPTPLDRASPVDVLRGTLSFLNEQFAPATRPTSIELALLALHAALQPDPPTVIDRALSVAQGRAEWPPLHTAWTTVRDGVADMASAGEPTEPPDHRAPPGTRRLPPVSIGIDTPGGMPHPSLYEFVAASMSTEIRMRWLVTGAPGGGKTTACRQLIAQWADKHGHASPDAVVEHQPWSLHHVPWYIPLDGLAERRSWQARELSWAVAAHTDVHGDTSARAERELENALARIADAGRLALIFDGLDELDGPRQASFVEFVGRVARCLPRTTIIILSREGDFAVFDKDPPWGGAAMRALGLAERHMLVEHRLSKQAATKLLEEPIDQEQDDKQLIRRAATKLLADLDRADEPTRRLADNPLLLTLIARLPNPDPRSWRGPKDALAAVIDDQLSAALSTDRRQSRLDRRLLGRLALRLMAEPGAWSQPHLLETIDAVAQGCGLQTDAKAFLDELGSTHLMQASGREALVWRFSHHAIRDRLAAEILAAEPDRLRAWLSAMEPQPGPLAPAGGRAPGLGHIEFAVRLALDLLEPAQRRRLLEDAPTTGRALGLSPSPDQTVSWPPRVEKTGEALLRWTEGIEDVGAQLQALLDAAADRRELGAVDYALTRLGMAPTVDVLRAGLHRITGRPWRDPGIDRCRIDPPAVIRVRPAGEQLAPDIPFALGQTPVTVDQYRTVFPCHQSDLPDDWPVTEVTWWDARLFARLADGDLPTEHQWELAAHRFPRGHRLEEYAWFGANAEGHPHPVGAKRTIARLHDLLGNVAEWCAEGPLDDRPLETHRGGKRAAMTANDRAVRGGSFRSYDEELRPTSRDHRPAAYSGNDVGLRVCFAVASAGEADR